MIIHPGVMGIDISKSSLDIFDPASGHERIANTASAIEALVRRCAEHGIFVLFEATGRYDALLRRSLAAAGVACARVNPARARDFARAAGFLAKTDAVDARMLAAMAQCLRPGGHAVPAERERLALLHKRRDQLVATRQQERTRRTECSDPEIAADLDRHLRWLDTDIAHVENRIGALLADDQELARLQLLLRSAPGVGPVTATTLMALLPEPVSQDHCGAGGPGSLQPRQRPASRNTHHPRWPQARARRPLHGGPLRNALSYPPANRVSGLPKSR